MNLLRNNFRNCTRLHMEHVRRKYISHWFWNYCSYISVTEKSVLV